MRGIKRFSSADHVKRVVLRNERLNVFCKYVPEEKLFFGLITLKPYIEHSFGLSRGGNQYKDIGKLLEEENLTLRDGNVYSNPEVVVEFIDGEKVNIPYQDYNDAKKCFRSIMDNLTSQGWKSIDI